MCTLLAAFAGLTCALRSRHALFQPLSKVKTACSPHQICISSYKYGSSKDLSVAYVRFAFCNLTWHSSLFVVTIKHANLDDLKRQSNLKKHELDFVGCEAV